MHRIDHATADPDLHGVGKAGFIAGDPTNDVPSTRLTKDWCNDLQENVVGVVEGAGIELVKGDGSQLLAAITALIAAAAPSLAGYLRADTAATLSAGFFTAPVPVGLAAGHAVLDLDAGNVFTVAVDAPFTLDFPAGVVGKAGMVLVVATQDGVGGHGLTLAAGYRLAAGEWDITANAVNLMWVTSDGGGAALDVVIVQRGA